MPTLLRHQCPRRVHRPAARFAADIAGMSLVEFALIFPIVLTILLGTIEFSHSMMVDRKVTNAAQAVVDLIAQRQTFDANALTEIDAAALLMLHPFTSDFDVSIAHVPFDETSGNADMNLATAWRAILHGARQIPNAEAEAAANGVGITEPPVPLGRPGDAIVMLEFNYQYRSLLGGFFLSETSTFRKTNFARPRLIRQIAASSTLMVR